MFDSFQPPGKLFIVLGIIFLIAGIFFLFANKIPFLDKLPGDIFIQKKNFTFYFPIVTCIALSIILTLLFYLIKKFR